MPISVAYAHDPIDSMKAFNALPSIRKEKGYEDEGDDDQEADTFEEEDADEDDQELEDEDN